MAIHCKKEGVNLADLTPALRIRSYIKELGTEDERVEQFIASCSNSHNPQKLVDVLEKVGHIDVPLEELEEHIKQKRAEKETLLHEIDEARAQNIRVNLYTNAIVKIIKDSYPKFTIGRIETISASSSVQEGSNENER